MSPRQRILGIGRIIFIMAVVGGCAVTNSGAAQPEDAIPAGYTYSPKLPPGIESIDAVQKDLAEFFKNRNTVPFVKYYGQPGINTIREKDALRAFVKPRGLVLFIYDSNGELLFMDLDGVKAVLEDRIELNPRIAFFYDELVDTPFVVEKTQEYPFVTMYASYRDGRDTEWQTQTYTDQDSPGFFLRPYKINFPGSISFLFGNLSDAQRFADDLFFIQQVRQKKHDERLALFQAKAAQYRGMKVKPPVSEEQRRYIVQANALNQRKEYARAIELYNKTIALDPVSYPEAYFNLALLSAQMQRFKTAIAYMKQYLLLAPDAKDARGGQDKIYEWELMINQ
ncbi:MAG: tetratricopeptide repeat protein [Desulfobulbia bacterium]